MFSKMSKEFISPLMLLRTKAGLTQSDLAELLGVHPMTVSRWERGEVEPALNLKQVKALLLALKINPEELPDSFAPQPLDSHSLPQARSNA
jgi:transcriptional regulator with XRE-family HTH domain